MSESEQLRTVFITPDLSLQERKVQRDLRSELKRRKDAGESDLIIRRGQIVKKNVYDMAMSVDVSPPLLVITMVVIRVGNTYASSIDSKHSHPKGFPDSDPSHFDLSPDTEHNGTDTIFN